MARDVIPPPQALRLASLPSDQHPVTIYLARLRPSARRASRQALDTQAGLLSACQCDAMTFEWPCLRSSHTIWLRQMLIERYSPATINKMLSVLCDILRECERLGLMHTGDCARAIEPLMVKARAYHPVPQIARISWRR